MTEKEKETLERLLQKSKEEKKKDKIFFSEVLKRKDEVLKFLNEHEEKSKKEHEKIDVPSN